jgi:hypothetical protein
LMHTCPQVDTLIPVHVKVLSLDTHTRFLR